MVICHFSKSLWTGPIVLYQLTRLSMKKPFTGWARGPLRKYQWICCFGPGWGRQIGFGPGWGRQIVNVLVGSSLHRRGECKIYLTQDPSSSPTSLRRRSVEKLSGSSRVGAERSYSFYVIFMRMCAFFVRFVSAELKPCATFRQHGCSQSSELLVQRKLTQELADLLVKVR